MIGDRVTFEDEGSSIVHRPSSVPEGNALAVLMVKSGLANTPQQALILQIIVSVLLIAIALVLFIKKPNTERYGNYDEIKAAHPELFLD